MNKVAMVGLMLGAVLMSPIGLAEDGASNARYQFGFVGDVDVSCGGSVLSHAEAAPGVKNVGGACFEVTTTTGTVHIVDDQFGQIGGFIGYIDANGDFKENTDGEPTFCNTGGFSIPADAQSLVVFVNGAVYQQVDCTDHPGAGTEGTITVTWS